MINKWAIVSLAFLLLWTNVCFSQSESPILSYQEYVDNIYLFHPIAKRMEVRLQLAEIENLSARGNLDPTIQSNWSNKHFDKKHYYRQFQSQFQLPTKLGIDVIGGYELADGVFLNPENKTDRLGLWNLGIEANVLQGLVVNERKLAFERASVFQEMVELERKITLNELIYAASLAYLEWQQYHAYQAVLEDNNRNASNYFKNTKESYLNGEKSAMDTLEAFILQQDALNLAQKNAILLVKARQHISNFLWNDTFPFELQPSVQPEKLRDLFNRSSPDSDIDKIIQAHPIILASLNKQSFYEIDLRLKKEKLKPKLKVKYNPLLATSENSIAPNYALTNYKLGVDFSMPLMFRSEKAAIQRSELKLQEGDLTILDKQNTLKNKIDAVFQQLPLLNEQLRTLEANVARYQVLLNGENEKFRLGESSVFLLNKRQEKYTNGQLKLIALKAKIQEYHLTYLYYANALN